MTIRVEVSGMDKLQARMKGLEKAIAAARRETAQEWGSYWFNSSQEVVPVDNGILAGSGSLEVSDQYVAVVYTAPYAAAVEYGWKRTDPIEPVRKKALAWEANRKERLSVQAPRAMADRVIVSRVVTPASFKGFSYVREPLKRARPYLAKFWTAAVKKHIRGGS